MDIAINTKHVLCVCVCLGGGRVPVADLCSDDVRVSPAEGDLATVGTDSSHLSCSHLNTTACHYIRCEARRTLKQPHSS